MMTGRHSEEPPTTEHPVVGGSTAVQAIPAVLEVVEPRGARIRRFVARLGGLAIVLLIVLMLYTLIHEVATSRKALNEAIANGQQVRTDLSQAKADREKLLATVQQQNDQLARLTDGLLAAGVDPTSLPPVTSGGTATPSSGGTGSGGGSSGSRPGSGSAGGTGSRPGGGGGSAPSSGTPAPTSPAPSPPPAPPPPPQPCLILNPLTQKCVITLP
jgi:uncharacterized membrane protein YgcG